MNFGSTAVASSEGALRSFKRHAEVNTVWLSSIPILKKNTLVDVQESPATHFLPPTSRDDLQLHDLDCPHAAQALYIYKQPCLLQDSSTGSRSQHNRFCISFIYPPIAIELTGPTICNKEEKWDPIYPPGRYAEDYMNQCSCLNNADCVPTSGRWFVYQKYSSYILTGRNATHPLFLTKKPEMCVRNAVVLKSFIRGRISSLFINCSLISRFEETPGLLFTSPEILYHGRVTRTTSELAPQTLTAIVRTLISDRFHMHQPLYTVSLLQHKDLYDSTKLTQAMILRT
ncbi:hypothetical protein TNCV_2335851 [Trichonephila clavipes]|uniref:Uncharacterized protein n=1 Tax=Trichonephila clavipes TaxID=2585209 RepID=A0A8X6SJG2_TRICX|nr:hypothetical protein TNCV_2335851 [Trichonephila clavipes]